MSSRSRRRPGGLRTVLAAVVFAAAPAAAQAAPALWQVSDADSSVWLFGSIHVLPPDVTWRTPAFDDVLKKADQVYFEADIGPLGQLGLILQSLTMGFTTKEPWLPRLTPDQTAKLSAAIAPLGLTMEQIGAFPPWLAEATIEEKVIEKQGYNPALGVDMVLQGELPKERKAYFETVAGQLKLLAGDTEERQIERLMTTVDTNATLPGQLGDMAASWSNGAVDKLAGQLSDDPTMDPAFTQTLVLDRNSAWVSTIEGLLKDNHNDLIVVGAGHLAGAGSVVDMLGKAGFTVRRIQ
jgi:uncharacterized protein YbaP (TraB family)